MVTADTIEGMINRDLWYHYDIGSDVLYLSRVPERETTAFAEETSEGFLLRRCQETDRVVGMTVMNWWRDFGEGSFPDSLARIGQHIDLWSQQHPLAA